MLQYAIGLALVLLGCIEPSTTLDTGNELARERCSLRSTPRDGDTGVAPNATIVLELDRPVDPATVDGFTVALWDLEFRDARVPTRITLDGSHRRITIDPKIALKGRHRLQIDGIRSHHGAAFREQIEFTALHNEPLVERSFPVDDAYVIETTLDHEGRPAVRRFATADGEQRTTFSYQPRSVESIAFGAPGADGVWGTADDVFDSSERIERDEHGFPSLWIHRDATGIVEVLRSSQVGAELVRDEQYAGPGPDGEWLSEDDELGYYFATERGERQAERTTYYVSAGTDGTWHTPDDVASWVAVPMPNGDCCANDWSGNDLLWGTVDDRELGIRSLRKTSDDNFELIEIVKKGPDRAWGTEDDVPTGGGRRYRYEHGVQTLEEGITAPGPDGVIGSADDEIGWYYLTEVTRTGAKRREILVMDPGPDAQWYSADDVLYSETLFETRR
jgi:hypothetical protein